MNRYIAKKFGIILLVFTFAVTIGACDLDEISNDELLKITRVEDLDSKTVDYGTEFEDLNLSEYVEVTLENYSVKNLPVEWQKGDYDRKEAETYKIAGELDTPEDITNPEDLAPVVEVTLKSEQYILDLEVEGEGTIIEPGEDEFVYDAGKEVNLKAEADEDWIFINWTGEVENKEDKETKVMMNSDRSITAVFREELNIKEVEIHEVREVQQLPDTQSIHLEVEIEGAEEGEIMFTRSDDEEAYPAEDSFSEGTYEIEDLLVPEDIDELIITVDANEQEASKKVELTESEE